MNCKWYCEEVCCNGDSEHRADFRLEDETCVDEAGGVYIDANDVAMMMALLKIARIAAGGGKADSWIDLAGYAACGAECEGVTE